MVMLAKKNAHHLYGGPRLLTVGLLLGPCRRPLKRCLPVFASYPRAPSVHHAPSRQLHLNS